MSFFIFDGVRSDTDLYLIVDGANFFRAGGRKYNSFEVPGRSGKLHIATGAYDNFPLKIKVAFKDDPQIDMAVSYMKQVLLVPDGYRKLYLNSTGAYYLARYSGDFEMEAGYLLTSGKATFTFDCQPFLHFDSMEIFTTLSTAIKSFPMSINYVPSWPLIRFEAIGSSGVTSGVKFLKGGVETAQITLVIGQTTHTSVEVDTKTRICTFEDGSSAARYITFSGTPIFDGNMTARRTASGTAKLAPRWCAL